MRRAGRNGDGVAGTDFASLAKQFSDDTQSKDKGGALGPIGASAVVVLRFHLATVFWLIP